MENNSIYIPVSKMKLVLYFIMALLFITAGIFFLTGNIHSSKAIFNNRSVQIILGFVTIVFFGLIAFTFLSALLRKNVGLFINAKGLEDNSGFASAGLIRWNEISALRKIQVINQQFLVVELHDHDAYMQKQTGFFRRLFMNLNLRNYGSAVTISGKNLKTSQTEVFRTLMNHWDKYKSPTNI